MQFIVVEVGHTIEKNTLNHIYNVLKLSVHSFLLTIETAFPCVHGFMLVPYTLIFIPIKHTLYMIAFVGNFMANSAIFTARNRSEFSSNFV